MISVILQYLVMLILSEEANDVTNAKCILVSLLEKIFNNWNIQDVWYTLTLETKLLYYCKKF